MKTRNKHTINASFHFLLQMQIFLLKQKTYYLTFASPKSNLLSFILISSISLPSQSTLFIGLFNLLIVLELPTPPLCPKLVGAINSLSFDNLEISVLFPLGFYSPLSSRLNLIDLKMLPRCEKQVVNYMSHF